MKKIENCQHSGKSTSLSLSLALLPTSSDDSGSLGSDDSGSLGSDEVVVVLLLVMNSCFDDCVQLRVGVVSMSISCSEMNGKT